MIRYVVSYVATLAVFLALDAMWLSVTGERLYRATLGDIMLPKFAVAPAAAFYIVFMVGVIIFAVAPAIKDGQWTTAVSLGALFGFFSFGLYDFTNMATLRNWTAPITAADVSWGTFLTGASATAGFFASQFIK